MNDFTSIYAPIAATGKLDGHPEPVIVALKDLFASLEAIRKDVPGLAMDYVLNGDSAQVLHDLRTGKAGRSFEYLATPGSIVDYYHSVNSKADTRVLNARVRLYQLLDKPDIKPEQWQRLAQVFAASYPDPKHDYYAAAMFASSVPEWLQVLLADIVITMSKRVKFGTSIVGPQAHLTKSFFDNMATLATMSVPAETVFFERDALKNSWHVENLEKFWRLKDFDTVWITPELTLALAASLSNAGRLALLKFLGSDEQRLVRYSQTVVKLGLMAGKKLQGDARLLLSRLPLENLLPHLNAVLLGEGSNAERKLAAEMLIPFGVAAEPTLQTALKEENNAVVKQVYESVLSRLQTVSGMTEQDNSFDVPTWEPLVTGKIDEAEVVAILQQNHAEILKSAQEAADAEAKENEDPAYKGYKSVWSRNRLKEVNKIDAAVFPRIAANLNGGEAVSRKLVDYQLLNHKNRIEAVAGFDFGHFLRLSSLTHGGGNNWWLIRQHLNKAFPQGIDLRVMADAIIKNGRNEKAAYVQIADEFLGWMGGDAMEGSDADKIWPFFYEHPEFLQEAFGLIKNKTSTSYGGYQQSNAVQVLAMFPKIPSEWLPILLTLALEASKTLREPIQQLLLKMPDIYLRACEGLVSGKHEIRTSSAKWLADLQDERAIPDLQAALKKEKRETARAAILTTLKKLGVDISSHLAPKVLLAEAESGLKGKMPKSLDAWLKVDALPELVWQDSGKAVDAKITLWWVVLAQKLKEPGGNELLDLYLEQTTPASRARLAEFLLHGFINEDTRHPSHADAEAEAQKGAPQRFKYMQQWYKQYPEYYGQYANATLEMAVAEIKREILAQYLGSAIADKGILALTAAVPATTWVQLLQAYMKEHQQRRAQIEAMLMAAAKNNDPAIIQFILSIARRYKTASVQAKANELIAVIAERNGWSSDELADRTIPTAGLDDNGVLTLSYGEREFTGRLDEDLKWVLADDTGKTLKAMPNARQNEDAALVKEAKAQFNTSKKELKQVLELQTERLYEAMCGSRVWSQADWSEYLQAHPLMQRLLQRLLWQGLNAEGEVVFTFRPTEDGSFINADDDEIDLQAASGIRLAHTVLLGPEQTQVWQAHLKDYRIKPLFEQLKRELPPEITPKQQAIDSFKGYLSDTFTLRGVFTKMGYQRGPAEDGGSFMEYHKRFNSLGVAAQIGFSGSYMPEENIPAVVYDLGFVTLRNGKPTYTEVNLSDISLVLLTEIYNDYALLASKTMGFDPDWEKKTPW